MTRLLRIIASFSIPALVACADDGSAADTTTEGDSSSSSAVEDSTAAVTDTGDTTTVDQTTGGDTSSGTDDGSSSGGGEPQVSVVVAFDGAASELPEGLFVAGDDAIVGFALTGAIERIDWQSGTRNAFATTPPPPPNTSFVTGVTLDADDRLLVAVVSFTADLQAGIYRAPADGGDAVLWASDPAMPFPNGFAFDADGRLYVSDSAYGGLFTIDDDGLVTPWLQDPLLAGDMTNCNGTSTIAVGANGIAWQDGSIVVAGNDKGVLMRVPIEDDGSAGTPQTIAGPDCTLAGIDGITIDDDGSVVAAINRANRVVRIADGGTITVIAEGAPLDFPATVAYAGEGEDRTLLVTSFALAEALAGGSPAPALVRIDE